MNKNSILSFTKSVIKYLDLEVIKLLKVAIKSQHRIILFTFESNNATKIV